MEKKLIVFVQDYPFYKGEPFFHLELQELVRHMDKILIVPRHIPNRPGESPHFVLPEGVDILNIPVNPGWKEKLSAILGLLRPKHFLRLWRDLKPGRLYFNPLSLKTAIMYDAMANLLAHRLKSWFKKENQKPSDWLFYTYWCDDAAYMMAQWMASGLISRSVSRAHGADVYEQRHPNHYLPYREYIIKHLSTIVCISQHGQKHFWNRYPRYSGKFLLSRLGVRPQAPVFTHQESVFRLLSLSGIDRVKHLELLIGSLSQWSGKKLEWHHIGNGRSDAYEKEIKALAEEKLSKKGDVSYFFHGFISPSEVLNCIRKIEPHALINCSHFEGIPVAMMEATSLGIPLLGGGVGGVPEIVLDEKNGFVFEPGQAKALLEALARIIDLDESAYQEMRASSHWVHQRRFNSEVNYYRFSNVLWGREKRFDKRNITRLSDDEFFDPKTGVGVVDAGMGNVEAVQSMLRKLKIPSFLLSHPDDIVHFETLYLPGVGAFDKAMENLKELGLIEGIQQFVDRGGRLIGICLGMQLLFEASEEGSLPGLGLIPGVVKRIPETHNGQKLKVPHIGWAGVKATPNGGYLGLEESCRFYFTHSYSAYPTQSEHVLLYADYGLPLVAGVKNGNVLGFQFHPEKSNTFGLSLLGKLHQPATLKSN